MTRPSYPPHPFSPHPLTLTSPLTLAGGSSADGQLGDGTTPGTKTWSSVSAGAYHTCGIRYNASGPGGSCKRGNAADLSYIYSYIVEHTMMLLSSRVSAA